MGLEIPVRRRDDPQIDGDGLAAAQALDGALLEEAQDLHLQENGELPDLVEEERPAIGQLELALPLHVGAGERAALMPEQLGLEEGLGNGAAVDRHEGTVAP